MIIIQLITNFSKIFDNIILCRRFTGAPTKDSYISKTITERPKCSMWK